MYREPKSEGRMAGRGSSHNEGIWDEKDDFTNIKIYGGKYDGKTWGDVLIEDREWLNEMAIRRYIKNEYVIEMKWGKWSEFYYWVRKKLEWNTSRKRESDKLLNNLKEAIDNGDIARYNRASNLKMPFGKHKGKKLSELSNMSLEWYVENLDKNKWQWLIDECKLLLPKRKE